MAGQNNQVTEPDLRALLDQFKIEIMKELNCHAVGTVQLFDPVRQVAQVSINYQKTFFTGPNLTIEKYVEYPVLVDVPVIFLTGGLLAALTFPVQTGDTCLVFFNDRDISKWFVSGQVGPLPSFRMHAMSDGFALVGIRSMLKPILPFDPVNASLQFGASSVKVGPAGVVITSGPIVLTFPAAGGGFSTESPNGAMGQEPSGKFKFENTVTSLLEVVEGLIDVIKNLQTQTVMTSELANVTAASQTALDNYKTIVGSLLV